jgi:hypothetical protein
MVRQKLLGQCEVPELRRTSRHRADAGTGWYGCAACPGGVDRVVRGPWTRAVQREHTAVSRTTVVATELPIGAPPVITDSRYGRHRERFVCSRSMRT